MSIQSNQTSSWSIGNVIREAWQKVKGSKGTILLAVVIVFIASNLVNFVSNAVNSQLIDMGYSHKVPLHESKKYPSLFILNDNLEHSSAADNEQGSIEDSPTVIQLDGGNTGTAEHKDNKQSQTAKKHSKMVLVLSGQGIVYSMLIHLLLMMFIWPLSAGVMMLGVHRAANKPLSVSSIWGYYSQMFLFFVAHIVCIILIIMGYFLLILPGIYLSIALIFVPLLIADKQLGPFAAIKMSIKGANTCWFRLFGFMFVIILIFALGIITLGLGFIWIIPFNLIATGIIYREIFMKEAPKVMQDDTPQLKP